MTSKMVAKLEDLPCEILLEILSYLEAKDIQESVSKVNKWFKALSNTPRLKMSLFLNCIYSQEKNFAIINKYKKNLRKVTIFLSQGRNSVTPPEELIREILKKCPMIEKMHINVHNFELSSDCDFESLNVTRNIKEVVLVKVCDANSLVLSKHCDNLTVFRHSVEFCEYDYNYTWYNRTPQSDALEKVLDSAVEE